MTLHPASLLLGWLLLALALQWLPLTGLLGLATIVIPGAFWLARSRFLLLLRRARWLLLSVAVLFALATPGTALPDLAGALGLTREGGLLATTHLLRLTLLLALLSLLLERLGVSALIGGLYLLLAPLGESRYRSRIALRLLLVLEYVERKRGAQDGAQRHWADWLQPLPVQTSYPPIELTVLPLAHRDRAFMILALAALSGVYWWSLGPA